MALVCFNGLAPTPLADSLPDAIRNNQLFDFLTLSPNSRFSPLAKLNRTVSNALPYFRLPDITQVIYRQKPNPKGGTSHQLTVSQSDQKPFELSAQTDERFTMVYLPDSSERVIATIENGVPTEQEFVFYTRPLIDIMGEALLQIRRFPAIIITMDEPFRLGPKGVGYDLTTWDRVNRTIKYFPSNLS